MIETTVARDAYTSITALVDELVVAGLEHVCICPGSRSTPLALTCARHPELEIWTHIDERSAAFFALGLAKATGSPIALVATSGTAVVNFLPAVTEAYYARVPLLLLTADRPHELRDTGTNQTIDQVRLFDSHIRWTLDLPLPDADPKTIRYFRMAASRAFHTALGNPAGPVQLNFPLREPLVTSEPLTPRRVVPAPIEVVRPLRIPDPTDLERLAGELETTRRGLIICGPDTPVAAHDSILELGDRLQYPVLADPLSGLRTRGATVIDAYDTFLRLDEIGSGLRPDLILRFGAAPTSKTLNLFLERHLGCAQLIVDPDDGWRDPTLTATMVLHLDPEGLCNALVEALGPETEEEERDYWLTQWHSLNDHTRRLLEGEARQLAEPFEGRVFLELAELIPDGANLFIGNSMPIREMDTFFPALDRQVRCFGNRGTSGIDGVVSSALGIAAGTEGPLVLVIGDLSFYHDLNGLLAAKLYDLDATIILVNNDGGGIFSFLPQADQPEYFEELFGTPMGLDFQPIVESYGGIMTSVEDWDEFRHAFERSLENRGLDLIELRTDRAQNAALRKGVIERVERGLRATLTTLLDDTTRTPQPCNSQHHTLNGARYRIQVARPNRYRSSGGEAGTEITPDHTGTRPPLLLLHGFTGSRESWTPLLPSLEESYETITIDLLGHGLSDAPTDPERYRVERLVTDLIDLLDQLGIEETALLGYSMGGRLALHLATHAPERVSALILESTSPGILDDLARATRRALDQTLAYEIEAYGLRPFVDYWESIPLFESQKGLDPATRDRVRMIRLRHSPIGLANSLRGTGAGQQTPLHDRLGRITAPTLILAGELDQKYVRIAEEMAELIPNTSREIVPGVGHNIHLEDPESFLEVVLEFLEGSTRESRPTYHEG